MTSVQCTIDSNILNKDSLKDMQDIGLSFFASTCGKNRGAFVLDPPDGKTYGCLDLPSNIAKLAGVGHFKNSDVVLKDANSIKDQYLAGNLTATETLDVLEFLVTAVYKSTPDKDSNPYTCEFNGLAALTCNSGEPLRSPRSDGEPIRSVTLAGMFTDALWATGGQPLTLDEMKDWYTLQDFQDMKNLGLNTVQILVPTATFTPGDKFGDKVYKLLGRLLDDVKTAGLDAILALIGTGDELDAVVAAANYAATEDAVLALTIPSHTNLDTKVVIDAIRVQAPNLPVFIPMNLGDLMKIKGDFDQLVFGSLEMSHSSSVGDIASSSSEEDRSKLFYHEATSCMARSPMEFGACFQDIPIFLGSGFDLTIDDCVNQGISSTFNNYGQCDRFDETINSGWWARHRASFAARQLYAYERGLGWSFAAWKLYGEHKVGIIDGPAKLLSLKDVAAAGLFPDLEASIPAQKACLNPPENDFILGDATLSPTMGPPPDCGNGWWNYTTMKCDYWIPPPPPTPAPTVACPVCETCQPLVAQGYNLPIASGVVGAIIGAIIGAAVAKFGFSNRRDEYQTIPN